MTQPTSRPPTDASREIVIGADLLASLHEHRILLGYNCPPPTDEGYGWLKTGRRVRLHGTVRIESCAGLYVGPYKPMVGGRKYSGLCSMGSFSYSYSALPEPLVVGRYCSISSDLKFLDSTHPSDTLTTSAFVFRPRNALFQDFVTDRIQAFADEFDIQGGKDFPHVGHDVWIGSNVTLGMGIRIGTGAVIASGSIVTKDVPPYAVVAGNPAVVRRFRFDEDTVRALLASAWWEHDPRRVFEQDFRHPLDVCERIARGGVPLHAPRVLELSAAQPK